jgi:hypothetical protein
MPEVVLADPDPIPKGELPDLERIDRIYGRVKLRKLFLSERCFTRQSAPIELFKGDSLKER